MAAGVCALIVAVVAPAWGCVAGVNIRLDRELVAAGEELEVRITVLGTPRPPMMAIRLDRLDAPPLLTLVPNATSPTVVRVRLPKATAAGQHVLIANDEPYPRPVGEYGYLVARALLSVVDPGLAAGRPAVETVIDFDPPVRFPAVRDQLWVMGAQLLRIHHGGGAGGEFFSSPDEPFPEFLGRAGPALEGFKIDSITIKGQVEVASLGPIAGHVSARRVVGLPAPAAAAVASAVDNESGLPLGPPAVATLALVVAGGAGVLARRRHT